MILDFFSGVGSSAEKRLEFAGFERENLPPQMGNLSGLVIEIRKEKEGN